MSDISYTVVKTNNDVPTMEKWAEREVRLAIEKNCAPKGDDSDSWNSYIEDCYKSALKVYKVMEDEGHSGMSWNVTKNILIDLMNEIPLTPLTGEDDEWRDCGEFRHKCRTYQNIRRGSLFKDVYPYPNAHVEYHDNNRAYCYNVDKPDLTYGNGAKESVVDELYPITFPYTPSSKKFKVECDEFLCDKKMGDFDHYAILAVITPDGKRIPIEEFHKEAPDGWFKISKEEYYEDRAKRID